MIIIVSKWFLECYFILVVLEGKSVLFPGIYIKFINLYKFTKFTNILKRYCTTQKAYNFIFLTETPSRNMTFKKNPQVKNTSRSEIMLGFVFSLWCHLCQTIKIGANFLCNSLLYRNKRLLMSWQVFLSKNGIKWEI